MKEMRRVLALVLCFVMLVGYVPVGALAAEADATAPVETQAVEEVVEAVLGEAVSVSVEQSDSEPAVTEAPAEETEVVEEIVEAVIGPVISASKSEPEETEPATAEAVEKTEAAVETYPAETEAEEAELLGEETAYEEAVLAAVDGMLDAAIFCSDVHGSTSDLASVLGGVAGSGVDYSSIGFVGDTCLTVANTESTVNSALGYTPAVMFSYAASHDTENSADISTNWDYSGEVKGVSDYYLVYTIRETDMQTESAAASAAADFTEWAATVDTTKPLFIMTHRPLHERRNGCDGGNEWYEAIQPVAEKMDVVVFWGHNHTGENSVDTDAYYVAKDGDESMTITNGDTIVPNFTYMNAGYINANNQDPARIGVATTVQITDDSLIFQDYNSSGVYEGSYAHNVTVAREFAAADEEEKTISYITINEGNGAAYKQGDTLLFEMLVTYDDGSTVTVTQADCEYTVANALTGEAVELETAMATVGEYAATITYQGVTCGSKLYFTVSEEEDFNGGPTSYDTLSLVIGGATLTADVREATEDESVQTAMGTVENLTDYVAYDISADISAEGETATVSVPVPVDKAWDTSSLKAYYVADGEVKETIEGTYADGYFTFTVSHFSIYAVGPAGNTTKVELNGKSATVENATVTTTAKKTVYKLASTISSGSSYLIVNGNSAGSAYALANNSGSVASTSVTIKSDDTIGTYIELTDAADELWTVGGSYTFKNGSYYLGYTTSGSGWDTSYNFGLSTTARDWGYSSNRLSISAGWSTYYLYYNNGWNWSTSRNTVYFYVPTEIEYETTATVSGTYTIAGETLNAVVEKSGDTATLTSTLTFTPTSGSATTTDVSASASTKYEVYKDTAGIISGISGNTVTFTGVLGSAIVKVSHTLTIGGTDYTVNNYIQVNTVEPYYTIDILDATGVSITKTVIVKGATQMAESHALNLAITKNTSTSADPVTPTADKVTWKVVGYDAEDNRDDTVVTITENADGTGSLKFNKTGTAQITVYYEYADGKSVTDVINVSGSYDNFYTPKDDTADDFPEYPYNGSVRINKTAEAVGAFSQTGMAKVELSMTGVPYSSPTEIDVVIMLDMTGSMSSDAMAAAEESAIVFAESIVKNDDGTFNNNRISVMAFNSSSNSPFTYWELGVITADTWDSFCTEVRTASTDQTSGGTPYDEALEKCYDVLAAAKTDGTGNDRQQFCVFVSDGGPTSYKYITNYDAVKAGTATSYSTSSASATGGANQSDSNFATIATYTHEYYSTLMKDAGVTIYSVGTGLTTSTYPNCCTILSNIASDSSKAYTVASSEDTSTLSSVFEEIGSSIREAAQDVTVEDVVGSDYDLTFQLPSGITTGETGMTEFYIQVLDYELDPTTHERTGEYTVVEKFTFNATTGACTGHWIDGSANSNKCGDTCSHVTTDGGEIVKIDGTYFDYTKVYKTAEDGTVYDVETLTWESDTLDTSELALQYVAYLNNSAGDVDPDDQVAPDTYYTNEHAYIYYTNHIGNPCRKEFPVPQMTWQGAQVTYRFYLVNENGEPVNRAGNVVPFQEATWVTDAVTDHITWNDLEDAGEEKILARDLLASANVPGVYSLYDQEAYYEIRVYETEGVDEQAANYNYFIIEGSDQNALNAAHPGRTAENANIATTKVFNTMQGTRYEAYGAYSQTEYWTNAAGETVKFTPTSAKSGTTYTPTITDDIDYGNTTVVFAVLWNQSLTPDTVVVDYGLDVVVNVSANDILASGVTGVRGDVPVVNGKDVVMNTGYYTNNNKAKTTEISINDTVIGTATVDSLQTVKFSLNKSTGMLFNDPAVIYYEADCNFYVDDVLNTNTMYTSLTVIPATTVYYEDEYVQLKTYTLNEDTGEYDGAVGWTVNSTAATDIQDVDRPGETANMDAGFDANNVYGYDSAYDNCSTYSLGKAAKASIDASKYATAEFDFYGTGFDVISMTSNTTGTLVVQAFPYNDDGTRATNASKSLAVDTYYGYDYDVYDVTYVYAVDYKTVTVTDENGNTVYKDDGVTPETKTVKYYDWRMTGAAECDSAKEETKDAATATNNSSYVLTEDTLPATAASGDTIIKREMYWKQVNNTNNALYQIPVMKIEGLTYGKYHAVITAAYSEWLDHTPTSNTNGTADGYDLYLDAIRIYNPAGTTYDSGTGDSKIEGDIDDVIQEAYKADNEAWPMYKELRDYIIGENDFNALEDGKQTSAAIFIDQNARTYTISDYKNYGPNNELYLAAGQAVSFVLDLKPYKDANITVADVQIGMKSADGKTVNVELTTIIGDAVNSSTATIDTATDRYYRIGDHVDLDGETIIVFENVDEIGTIASITNVKITFKQDPNGVATASDPITEDKESANAVLMLLNAVEEETEPEPEVTLDAELEVNIRKTSVKVGSTVVVKATTSADVAALTVNGTKITKYTENSVTGKRSWTATVKAEEAGDLEVEVIAYSADGDVLETATKTVEVTASKASIAQKTIDSIISKLFR